MKKRFPTINNVISLREVDRVAISPQSKSIAYTVKQVNWKKDVFDNHCFIYNVHNKKKYPIVKKGKIQQLLWYNESTLCFLWDGGNKRNGVQVWQAIINQPLSLKPLTISKRIIKGIELFSQGIVYYSTNSRQNQYHIYYIDLINPESEEVIFMTRNLSKWNILSVISNNNRKRLYINCSSFNKKNNYIYELRETDFLQKKFKLTKLSLPFLFNLKVVAISPTNNFLILQGKEKKERQLQENLWLFSFDGEYINLTEKNDIEPLAIRWTNKGLLIYFVDKLRTKLAYLDPENQEIKILDLGTVSSKKDCSQSVIGDIAFIGQDSKSFSEIYLIENDILKKVTNLSSQVRNWELGKLEKFSWTSRDGLIIQGVLRKPKAFISGKRHPLIIVLHGGPKDFSEFKMISEYRDFAPYLQLLEKGAMILEPNYRGSIGRGQKFMSSNVNSLGIKDLWDIESAIEILHSKGLIDITKIACIGWSQGGYISAFAATHSSYFKTVCIGAGIADWSTYYSTTDIPDFALSYLSGTPDEKPENYKKSSVIRTDPVLKTPMLIFHGAKDKRVSLICSIQLARYCYDLNICHKHFIISEMEHRIKTPKQSRLILGQSLRWILYHLFNK